jgi:uncharacterized protein involved in outer membrane biogenesis
MIKRRRVVILAGLTGLAALAAMPWDLAERSIERYMLSRLSAQFALAGTTAASGAVAFLPVPRIVANDVTVTSADGSVSARIPRVRADLRLMPLLAGRIEFDRLYLRAPQFEVRLASEIDDPLQMITSHRLSQLPALPSVSITDNGAVFLRRGAGIVSSVRDINTDVMARDAGEAVQASGTLAWRGEKLEFAFATNSAARDVLPMLRLRSDIVSVDFASARSSRQQAGPGLEGEVQIAARSMSRLGSWLASGSPVTLPLGSTSINGRLLVTAEGAQVSNASLMLGSDVLDGALDWRKRDQRWRLTGTLAGKNLDIGRPQAGIDMHRVTMPEPLATSQIDIDDLMAHDIDLRVSLQRVRLPGLVLSDVAGQLMASEQRLDLSISNAALYGGVARGRGSIARVPTGVEFRSQFTADRVDLAQLTADLFDLRRMTGTGSFQQTLETSGRTPAELVAHATGRFALTARNGEFLGTNLNDAMRRIERQPLSVVRDWRGGRTSFEQLSLTGVVSGGTIDITEARGLGPSFRLAMEGQVSLLERLFRLSGQVQSANGVASVPFDVLGPLNEPWVQVNARAFLERSGAAAPLLQPRAN